MNKVKFFCSRIHDQEWSGILFYEVQGSIKQPETLRLIAKDIYLMNKGSTGFTSFETDNKLVRYMMQNPELRTMKWGMIHSHHSMRVFFSGEDWDELQQTNGDHNFYLSLIVNNFNVTMARLAWTGKSLFTPQYQCLDENGEQYFIEGEQMSYDVMFTVLCDIDNPEKLPEVDKKYEERLEEVSKIYEEKKKNQSVVTSTSQKDNWYLEEPFVFSTSEQGGITEKPATSVEQFFTMIVRLGNIITNDSLEDALEDLEGSNVDSVDLVSSVIENYSAWYEKFFNTDLNSLNSRQFMTVLADILLLMAEYEEDYPTLNKLRTNLARYASAFEKSLLETT